MKNIIRSLLIAVLVTSLLTSCAVVMPDQVAVKRRLGKLDNVSKEPGTVVFNPFTTKVVRVYVRTKNVNINESLPSREGLTIQSESSILYSLKAAEAPKILKETGLNYEIDLILPVYRSAAADICSQYDAKDMHSAKRAQIEIAIQERMAKVLEPKGFIIEQVLLKNIQLPRRISESIERKLEAEQEALRMAFVSERERKEVERQIIIEEGNKQMAIIKAEGKKQAAIIEAQAEAEALEIQGQALKKYNLLVGNSLSPNLLKLKQIEAFQGLSQSQNSKLMIMDKETPIMNMFGGKD
ncbi:SPFH domain-containing protein [Cytophagaceae bacterium ABcell3]|nr:SPFH domain-containing protein [Cytophagaceae bacterium ABcell3]